MEERGDMKKFKVWWRAYTKKSCPFGLLFTFDLSLSVWVIKKYKKPLFSSFFFSKIKKYLFRRWPQIKFRLTSIYKRSAHPLPVRFDWMRWLQQTLDESNPFFSLDRLSHSRSAIITINHFQIIAHKVSPWNFNWYGRYVPLKQWQ